MPLKLALTMGDPGGVGPEIIVRCLAEKTGTDWIPVVYGDPKVFARAVELAGANLSVRNISIPGEAEPDCLNLIRPEFPEIRYSTEPTMASGHAAVACIRAAAEAALSGKVAAVVTAPISKESLRRARYPWPGHTEMLAEFTKAPQFGMMLVGGPLRVVLATIHEPLSRVPRLITEDRVFDTIRLAEAGCRRLGVEMPRIGVAGLNPHGGEAGRFGHEEARVIAPAVVRARAENWDVTGPYPPDTVFHKAYHRELDIIVCMYHDQGLIPLKMIAFDTGVNVTLGLPIIRTSPDHGTAFDIAWKGVARHRSMEEAIRLAARMAIAKREG